MRGAPKKRRPKAPLVPHVATLNLFKWQRLRRVEQVVHADADRVELHRISAPEWVLRSWSRIDERRAEIGLDCAQIDKLILSLYGPGGGYLLFDASTRGPARCRSRA
jgi:hypothetical protein